MPRSHALPRVADLPSSPIARPFLVVDPGKRTGLARVAANGFVAPSTCKLVELPDELHYALHVDPVAFIVCEDYLLAGGQMARNQAGSDMPSAMGIGMCMAMCRLADKGLYLARPQDKSTGRLHMDSRLAAAYGRCRNDHERDVVDLASFVLHTMKSKP